MPPYNGYPKRDPNLGNYPYVDPRLVDRQILVTVHSNYNTSAVDKLQSSSSFSPQPFIVILLMINEYD